MQTLAREARSRLSLLVGLVALIWLIELVDLVAFQGTLDRYGIRPRDTGSLWGIVCAPFLHGGLAHLIANTVPLLVLGGLVILRRVRDFLVVTALAIALGGLGIWLLGRPNTLHIGASGLVFGYLGFLLLRGYLERSFAAIGIALVAGALYGSVLWGVLPLQRGVSWEGHLFGFASGAGAAGLLRQRRPGSFTRLATVSADRLEKGQGRRGSRARFPA